MKRKFWNWVKNEGGLSTERTLFLSGEISDETWYGDEVTPKLFKDELYAGEGDITVWLNSPGGDVFAAAQIYNMLRDYKGNVTIKIDGLAASAASVIAMAGNTVLVSPVAMMMIHNPATLAIGNAKDMERAIAMLNEVKESILNAYEGKTGLSRARLSHMMDDETWFNAKKAVELGFADKILFDSGDAEDERLERQAAIDAELARATSTPITNQPNGRIDGEIKTGRASDEYKRAFWNGMRNRISYEVQNALSIGTDSEGGYLVPDEYEKKLVEALQDEVFFRSLATVIRTSSGDRKIPIVTSKGEAAWIDEGGQFPESDDSFGQTSIGAYKLATMIKVSDELLNDSTVKALRKLKDSNGNYIWQPSVREGEPDRILNRPYRTSIYVPELAEGNRVMAFGDYSYYWIADRQGRSFKRLNELYATTGQVGFLACERVDGKLILSEAVKTLGVKAKTT